MLKFVSLLCKYPDTESFINYSNRDPGPGLWYFEGCKIQHMGSKCYNATTS